MNRKTKEQNASEELKALRIRNEEDFATAIMQACGIADPAEKLLELERIRQVSSEYTPYEKNEILSTARKVYHIGRKEFATVMGLSATLVGGFVYAAKFDKNAALFRDRLTAEAQDYFASLSEQEMLLDAMIDAVLENHAREIRQSDLCEDVLSNLRLAQKFAAALVKQDRTAAQEPPADPVTSAIEQQTAQPRQRPDYGKLNFRQSPGRTI